jgi:hypothetical protein
MSIFDCPRAEKNVKKSKNGLFFFGTYYKNWRKKIKNEKNRKKSIFFFYDFFNRIWYFTLKVHPPFGMKLHEIGRKMTPKLVILAILAYFWLPELTKMDRAFSVQAVAAQT